MNHSALIFLGVLASFVASWWALIFAPQLQIGSQQSAQTDSGIYPTRRMGIAQQGHAVYVANGCAQCHSQQVQQDGYTFDLVLTAAGTNAARVTKILNQIAPGVNADEILTKASDKSPQTILKNVDQSVADDAQKRLKAAGANAQPVFIPLGPDMARHWGARRTVGADYLFEQPVQVGNSRLGSDLSNYGDRAPTPQLILAHLYDPRTTMPGSIMPAHRYLFETRPIGKHSSPHALKLTGEFAPKAGQEIIPTTDAMQLVTYLQSLRADATLFEAPTMQLAPPPAVGGTNAAGLTNVPPGAPAAAKP